MLTRLLQIGIVLIPFYDIIFRLFPFVNVTVDGTRPQRDIISLWLAILISLYGLYKGRVKAKNDKWLLAFLGFMFIVSFNFGSGMSFVINGIKADSFWLWRPMFYSLVYFLAYLTLINTPFTLKEIDRILKTFAVSSIIMACYILLQKLGIEQFFAIKPEILNAVQKVTNPGLAGFLGQPTLAAPFIAISIPIIFYFKWNLWALSSMLALWFVDSQVAIGATFFSLMVYSLMKKKQAWPLWVILIGGILFYLSRNPAYAGDNGRFDAWAQIILDWCGKPFEGARIAITGLGIGSFQYIFHIIHNSPFYQAHNEYLEVLWWGGAIGISIYGCMILNMFHRAYATYKMHVDRRMSLMVALIASFTCICLCSGGTFILQLGLYRFITLLILGIMLNNGLKRGIV